MRDFKTDFLHASETLRAFYPHMPGFPDVVSLAESRIKSFTQRALLVSALQKQYQNVPENPAVQKSLELLALPNALTLTTGHQLCLGTGPLYVILKTLSIIRQAEEWNQKFPQYHFIPVFWMASEDHDFAEADFCFPEPGTKIQYPHTWKGAVGRHILSPEISGVTDHEKLCWLKPYYQAGRTWAQAFRLMMHDLFGNYGLLLIDGDDTDLKESFFPVMRDELRFGTAQAQLNATSQELSEVYSVQAHVRERNLFWLHNAQRIPLKPVRSGVFHLPDGREVSLPEDSGAEEFSPSALLRPLYQEWILPNILYCGGWAEMAYWMQLRDLFKHYQIPYPALMPRFSATLFPEDVIRGIPDIQANPADVENQIFETVWPSGPWQEQARETLEGYSRLKNLVSSVDQSLIRTLEGEEHKLEIFLKEHFPKKIRKQLRNRHAEQFKALDLFKAWKQPEDNLQERVLNISAFSSDPFQLIAYLYKSSQLQPGKMVNIILKDL